MSIKDLLSPETDSDTRRQSVAPFLLHLRQMLRRESPNVIRWTEDGLAFQILDKDALTKRILPQYFKNKSFASFQRQLNYFGFRKWTKAKSAVPTYSREHFTRDNYEDMALVKRQSKKSRKRTATEEVSTPSPKRQAVSIELPHSCKKILPRPNGSPNKAVMSPVAVDMVPPVHFATTFVPELSPSRQVGVAYKLPSIRDLSMGNALRAGLRA